MKTTMLWLIGIAMLVAAALPGSTQALPPRVKFHETSVDPEWPFAIEDLDADGAPDLVDAWQRICWNTSQGWPPFAPTVSTVGYSQSRTVANMNGDSYPDLILYGKLTGQTLSYGWMVSFGAAERTFTPPQPIKIDGKVTGATLVWGDFDGDGDADALGFATSPSRTFLAENPGTGGIEFTSRTVATSVVKFSGVIRLPGRSSDSVVFYGTSSASKVRLALTPADIATGGIAVGTGSYNTTAAALLPLGAAGSPVLVYADNFTVSLVPLTNGLPDATRRVVLNNLQPPLAAADLLGDGNRQLLGIDTVRNLVAIHEPLGGAPKRVVYPYVVEYYSYPVLSTVGAHDFDHDGDSDLVVGPLLLRNIGQAALLLKAPAAIETREDGTGPELKLQLNTRPTTDVLVLVSTSDPTEAEALPPTLRFTPNDWDTTQTVAIQGVDDSEHDQDQRFTVSIRSQSADPDYDDLTLPTIPGRNEDDDVANTLDLVVTRATLADCTSADCHLANPDVYGYEPTVVIAGRTGSPTKIPLVAPEGIYALSLPLAEDSTITLHLQRPWSEYQGSNLGLTYKYEILRDGRSIWQYVPQATSYDRQLDIYSSGGSTNVSSPGQFVTFWGRGFNGYVTCYKQFYLLYDVTLYTEFDLPYGCHPIVPYASDAGFNWMTGIWDGAGVSAQLTWNGHTSELASASDWCFSYCYSTRQKAAVYCSPAGVFFGGAAEAACPGDYSYQTARCTTAECLPTPTPTPTAVDTGFMVY